MNLSDIGGVELNNNEKQRLRGGDDTPSGTCAFKDPSGNVLCGLDKESAIFFYEAYGPGSGANWCCDSCPTTEWWIETCGSEGGGGEQ